MIGSLALVAVSAFVVACGPAPRPDNGDDSVTPDAPARTCPDFPTGEDCADGIDNDCDGRGDCSDVDCSGVGSCPVCGMVEAPQATPLALPDGVSSGTTCTTDADCTAAAPNCVYNECHASYTSTLDFIGFPSGLTLTDPAQFLSVCANIEHSWMRDLQIDLITPDDRIVTLLPFVDRSGDEVYLGAANDGDSAASPVPGTGAQYCWTTAASLGMLDAPTMDVGGNATLPAGDYRPSSPFSTMMGTPLNGAWTMRVTDLWGIDNGFMFNWTITFDPTLIADCAGPIIL